MESTTTTPIEHTFLRLRIPVEDLDAVKRVADREFDGVVSMTIRRAIREYLEDHGELESRRQREGQRG